MMPHIRKTIKTKREQIMLPRFALWLPIFFFPRVPSPAAHGRKGARFNWWVVFHGSFACK